MPSNFLRLKLVIKLTLNCGSYLDEVSLDDFLIYLQSYFLSKDNVDMDTIFEYQQLLKDYAAPHYKTFEEADKAVAALEASAAFDGEEIRPHSTLYVTDEHVSDEEVTEQYPTLQSSSEARPVVKDEDDLILEKKYNDKMKGGQIAISNRRVNLDNMVIPMNLQVSQEPQNGVRLLFKGKSGVGVGIINMKLTEGELEKVQKEVMEKRNDRHRLKQKTIHLNETQLEDNTSIQQIHNDRSPVPAQSYQRK